jgi:anthranilate synthase component 1
VPLDGLLTTVARCAQSGKVELSLSERPALGQSNTTKEGFLGMIAAAKEYIAAGDIFQVVLSQRFERRTWADPFEIYRSLRIVNPSPYMIYLQARGCILVASSPEILCRVDNDKKVRAVFYQTTCCC